MTVTLDDAAADPQQLIADLRQKLDERTAERDGALAREAATAEVLQVINASPGDLGPVFDAMLENAIRLCEADVGNFWTYDGEAFTAVAMRDPRPEHVKWATQRRRGGPGSISDMLIRGESVVHIRDAADTDAYRAGEPARRAIVDLNGGRTLLAVALRKGKELLGYINIFRRVVRPFTDKQIALLQNFAGQAVIAMENARLITETREALEQQTATAEVLQVINASPGDLTPVFDAILEKAHTLCGAVQGAMFLFDGEHLRAVATRGMPEAFNSRMRAGYQAADFPLTQALLAGEPFNHVVDLALLDHPVARAAVELAGAHTVLAVALRKGNVLLGQIVAARREVRPFTNEQIALLQNFAAQAVIAMENARLITETREALEQQTATAEVLQVINSSPGDLAPVFDAMLERALRLCGAAFGNLLIYNGKEFHAAAAVHAEVGIAEAFLHRASFAAPPDSGLERLVQGNEIDYTADILQDGVYRNGREDFRELVDAGGYRGLLNVALHKDGSLHGVIGIFRQELRPFSEKEIDLLRNFAAQAVIAIENARLINETREALEQQTATAEVLQVINSSPGELAPVFDAMLEKATRLSEGAFGILWIFEGEFTRAGALHNVPEAYAELIRTPFRPSAESGPARVMRGDGTIVIPDLMELPGYSSGDFLVRAIVDLGGARSVVIVPMPKDGGTLGAITTYRTEVRPFTDKQIALLENFAEQAVIAMENARLLTETREALEQQTATAEILGSINSSLGDLSPVFDTMLARATRLCDASCGNLFTYDGEFLHTVAAHGDTRLVELLRQVGAFQPGSHIVRLLKDEPFLSINDATKEDRFRRYIAVPLRKDDRLLGFIAVYREDVRPFTDKQIALLQNFAAQAVIAMENARLITETQEALEQQTATAEVLGVINSSPGDLAPVFDAMLEKAMRLCEAETAHLLRYENEVFSRIASRGVPEDFDKILPLNTPVPHIITRDSIPYRMVATRAVVHVHDSREDESVRAGAPDQTAAAASGIRTALFVPLLKEGDVVGGFVMHRMEVRPFADKQIALLQNFAAQAVIAMENARLLGELRQRTEEVAELNRGLEARVAEQVDELGRVGRLKRFLAPQLAELIVSQGDEKILESHRREIVVVFCDLRGYTAFTETAEPEEVLDFLREYHGALGPLVSQFEGTLDQFSGDGIMVFFNDPVPIPDAAERAVNMAVAMREAARTLIADWRERGRDLGFGAGIAQGYATLGQIGFSERSGYTAIGTVCNVAARLCADAKDGQILLSQRVNVALKGSIGTEQLGALALKGLSQPVVAYNVPLVSSQAALRVIEGGAPSI